MRATGLRSRTPKVEGEKAAATGAHRGTPMLASLVRRTGHRVYQAGGASLWSGHKALVSQWQPATAQGRALTRTHVTIEDGPVPGSPRVVILGGGFGGLYTAVRLQSLFWPRGKKPQVTVIDQAGRFVFKPLLYELINGGASEQEVAPGYTQLLDSYPVRFIQSKVVGAEPAQLLKDGGSAGGGKVKLAGGAEIEYDWLVVALGAQSDSRGIPGVVDRAVPFNTLEDALKVRDAMASIEARGSGEIVVVGAGYAGVELACVIAERLKGKGLNNSVQVRLVTPGPTILESSGLGQRQASAQMLAELGVKVVTGTRVRSIEAPAYPEGALPTAAAINLDDRPPAAEQLQTAAAEVAAAAAKVAADFSTFADDTAASLRNTGTPQAVNGPRGQPQATTVSGATGASELYRGVPAAAVESGAQYAGPTRVEADLVLWTAGSSPVTKAERKGFPFPTNARGSVETDATLRVLSHTRVFALGDVCVADKGYVQDAAGAGAGTHEPSKGTSFPATAQVAFQQADYVAWNVWAGMMGRPLLPFRYQHLGSMMSLGSFNAAVDLPVPVPSAVTSAVQASPLGPLLDLVGVKLTPAAEPGASAGVTLEGPFGALLRRAAYLYRQPTGEQRLNVAAEWASQASGIASAALANLQQQRAR